MKYYSDCQRKQNVNPTIATLISPYNVGINRSIYIEYNFHPALVLINFGTYNWAKGRNSVSVNNFLSFEPRLS